jgi:hypothetical protein
MLVALSDGCKKEKGTEQGTKKEPTCDPVELTAPWKDMGLPLGPDVVICASNSDEFSGSGSTPTAWPVLAESIEDKLKKDGWTTVSEPDIDKTGFAARMRKGDKGLLVIIDALPHDFKIRPFTINIKKEWPAGKPSAEW